MVSYLRDSGQTKTAAVVAEGAAKPELTLVLSQIDAALMTIAVWVAVSNQTVEDVADFRLWLDDVFALVYLSGAPLTAAPIALLWGVPVVPSPAMPVGEALVGNFRRGGALYGKQGLRMMAWTEHADFFTKNLTAVLGEMRAVLAISDLPR